MDGKHGFFSKIKELLFGKDVVSVSVPKSEHKSAASDQNRNRSPVERQQPYFLQIGFDFGTSYSKCVCRDVITDKAWVYIPNGVEGLEEPFLIPSTILLKRGKLCHSENCSICYQENCLPHLKIALVKTALKQWDAPELIPYKEAISDTGLSSLSQFVEVCAVYFLAGAIGRIRKDLRQRFPDFGENLVDYMAINIAVPVADAERPDVEALFRNVLCTAWNLADKLAGHPPTAPETAWDYISECRKIQNQQLNEACFLYPEVSANVQGFVRSRASKPGMYLFSDTGAGSVDQSVFIFLRGEEGEHLTYLHGTVLPLGSSKIEYLAASTGKIVNNESLEGWRKRKEGDCDDPELRNARDSIAESLQRGTTGTLAWSIKKLFVKEQIYEIRVIFGGGGHCDNPYRVGVIKPFSGNLFRKGFKPDIVGLPIPPDLELGSNGPMWIRRLSVAYGLSFVRTDLSDFTYPKDLKNPEPHEIIHRFRKLPDAPTKDEC